MHDAYSASAFYIANGGYMYPPGGGNRIFRAEYAQIDRCLFEGGSANHVIGGEYNYGEENGVTYGWLDVSNCLFDNAKAWNGTFYGYTCRFRFRNCTFIGMDNGFAGRAINTYLYNCIVVGTDKIHDYAPATHWPDDIGQLYLDHVLMYDAAVGEESQSADSIVQADPLFRNAVEGDYRLTDASPAINAGSGDLAMGELDFGGESRFRGIVDLGCHEFHMDSGFMLIFR